MYRSNSKPQSGLLQLRPQRYSDRHAQQNNGSVDYQPRGWYEALTRRGIEKAKQPCENR